jgi:CubicO group peptidase (beta-lactamase class C family)
MMQRHIVTRRAVLLGTGAALAARPLRAAADWTTIAPGDAGFAPDLAARLDEAVNSGAASGVHGIVVVRDGRLALERYYRGADERRGDPLGAVEFGPDVLHDLRSVSKSIVGLLYGIALADGKVPAPAANLLAQFPEYPDLAADPQRAAWTIGNVLTMTLGTEWDEQMSYADPRNSEVAMDRAPDRYRFVLERPIVAPPGTRWIYCGGATALLGRLIARGTGRTLQEYARTALFDPLGIGPTDWIVDSSDTAIAASGLRMRPRDLARIGQLVLDGGTHDGRQLVPAAWLTQALTPHVVIGGPMRYGYQWYLGALATGAGAPAARFDGAIGNGGQRLYVLPERKLAVAITAGNYNLPTQGAAPLFVMQQVILPSLRG